ncbi:MAG: hypothetical protein RIE56_13095 [Amphiplicatus sp.]
MRVIKAGLASGVVGGALDLIAACVVYPAMYKIPAIRIPQSIASGVLGADAYKGGAGAALLGVGLHFFIAIVAGFVLAVAMNASARLRRMAIATGAVFGVAVYYFMQKIVLPLSQAVVREPDLTALATGLATHVLLFGVPMALVAKRFLTSKG